MVLHIDISRNNPPDCKDPYWNGYDLLVSIPLWLVCNFITVLLLRKYVSEYEEQRTYTSLIYRFLPMDGLDQTKKKLTIPGGLNKKGAAKRRT